MEDLSWERNMWFPWINNINLHHQQGLQTFDFGSENVFSNPIQDLRNPNSTTCLNQFPPTSSTQHWSKTITINSDFHEGRNVISIPSMESLDCLLSASNSNTDSDHDEGISVLFPDYNNLCNDFNNPNNLNNPSTDSVTKELDDGIVSRRERKRYNDSGFGSYDDNLPKSKRSRSDPGEPGRMGGPGRPGSSTISFRQGPDSGETETETDSEAIAQMKEMIYRAAAFRPVSFTDDDVAERPRRKNVRISSDPQTVAARQRREKISERIRVLQKLVPGGNKMDTASMLDEAANYLKFLRSQVKALEQFGAKIDYVGCGGTSGNADGTNGTSQVIRDVRNVGPSDVNASVTLGVPVPMQSCFLLPPQQF